MAAVKPFAALRPVADLAARVCAPPYDVMTESEARRLAAADPLSFVHVSRPEVGLPEGTDSGSPEAYAAAREAFERLTRSSALRRDANPGFHVYRLTAASHVQTGIVGLASCADYRHDVIRKHELTRVEKEDDRVRHLEALGAQTGPAFLFHRPDPTLHETVRRLVQPPPDIDFTAPDSVRHQAWSVFDPEAVAAIRTAFARIHRLYIADGHHRSAAAVRVWEARGARAEDDGFLSVIFPSDALCILPYHRVVRDLNGLALETFHRGLETVCERLSGTDARPGEKGEFCLFDEGGWSRWRFQTDDRAATAGERLDVARLQRWVLEPILGIRDARTSDRLDFIGGGRGIETLEARVRTGGCALAFSLFPTRIEELIEVADAGGVMPPKSTWFEPKLRDALFCHLL